jgi:hypothetical protein
MRLLIAVLATGVVLAQFCPAQTKEQLHTMPSSAEILELADKANENVLSFEKALEAASPYLDDDTVKNDKVAAENAHAIIDAIRKKGASMYGLVGLLSCLDDLTLDASRASRSIMVGIAANSLKDNSSHNAAAMTAMSLMGSENSLFDISDFFLHVTLRYAAAEDDAIEQVLKQLK